MKKFNKIFKSVLAISMALVFIFSTGCKKEETGDDNSATIVPRPPVEKVMTLNETSLDMKVGDTKLLIAVEFDSESSDPIVWSSEEPTIAKVDEEGYVEAMGEGTTNIVATQGTTTAKCVINSSFMGEYAQVVVSVDDEFSIQQGKSFNLNPQILFNQKSFTDAVFTYSVADKENFTITNAGVLTGTKSGTSTTVIIEASWRGKTSAQMITLKKILKVNIIDSVNLLIDGYMTDFAVVGTMPEFEGKTYVTELPFVPKVYVNGELKQDAIVSVVAENSNAIFKDNKITGALPGTCVFTITYDHNGKALVETFTVIVEGPAGIREVYLDVGDDFRGMHIQGFTSNYITFEMGKTYVLPTLSLFGYEFKGWKSTLTGDIVPVVNGECILQSYDGFTAEFVAVWESTSVSGPVIP